jgi:hypothetical protein
LKHYFQAHKIRVLTNYPLKEVLQSCKTTERLEKWAAELYQHFIEFEKRTLIKSQVLADYSRLDTLSKFTRRKEATRTNNILQWRMGLRRGWSSYNNYLTFRHKDEICYKIGILMYK